MTTLGLTFQLTEQGPLTVMFYDSYLMPVYNTFSREDFTKHLDIMVSPFGTLLYFKQGPLVNYAFPQNAMEKLNEDDNLIVLVEQRKYNGATLCDFVGYNVDSETPQYTSELTPSFTVELPKNMSFLHYDLPTLEHFIMFADDKEFVPTMKVSLYMPTGHTYRVNILMDVENDAILLECNDVLYGPFRGLGNMRGEGIRNLFELLDFHCACFLNDNDNIQLRYFRKFNMHTYDNSKWNIDPNGIDEYHAYTFRFLNSLQ